jgi:hypothetical protein
MKLEISRIDFRKISNTKFHENPSSGSRVVPCEQMDRQTDMTKLIFVLRHFEKNTENRGFIDQLNTVSFSRPVPVSGHITIN